ncbi:Frizzled-8 [Balamuthia mandrillaris]
MLPLRHFPVLLLPLFLVVLSSSSPAVSATTCEPFAGSPSTAGRCDVFLADPRANVTIPTGSTYEEVERRARDLTFAFSGVISRPCRAAGLLFTCLYAFQGCGQEAGLDYFGVLPCREVCTRFFELCEEDFARAGEDVELPITPAACLLLPESNGTAACNPGRYDLEPEYVPEDCPHPLVFAQDVGPIAEMPTQPSIDSKTGRVGPCILPCPYPYYSEAQLDGTFLTSTVVAWISLILSLFYVLSSLLSPARRFFPANLITWVMLSMAGLSLGVLSGTFVEGGQRKVICPADNRYASQQEGDAPCVIQALLITYFSVNTAAWLLILCFNTYLLFVREISQERLAKFYPIYHVVAWVCPLISCIVGLSLEMMEAIPAGSHCLVGHFGNGPDGLWLWLLVFVPSIPSTILSCIFFGLALFKLFKVRVKSSSSQISVTVLVRFSIAVFSMWTTLVLLLIIRIYSTAVTDDAENAVQDQVICSAVTGTECEVDFVYSYGIYFLLPFVAGILGTLMFVSLASPETFLVWVRLYRGIHWGDPKQSFHDLKDTISHKEDDGTSLSSSVRHHTTKKDADESVEE